MVHMAGQSGSLPRGSQRVHAVLVSGSDRQRNRFVIQWLSAAMVATAVVASVRYTQPGAVSTAQKSTAQKMDPADGTNVQYRAASTSGLGFAGGGDPYKYIRTGHYADALAKEAEVQQGWLDAGSPKQVKKDNGDDGKEATAKAKANARISALASAPVNYAKTARPEMKAAEEKGVVQKVRAESKTAAKHNVATHAKTEASGKRVGKIGASVSLPDIKAAATSKVKTHILADETPAAQELQPAPSSLPENFKKEWAKEPNPDDDVPAAQVQQVAKQLGTQLLGANTDPNPDKVLVKMFMESKCPACKKYSTTYLKDIVTAPGMRDIVDVEFVPWGFATITSPDHIPTDLPANFSSMMLPTWLPRWNHTSQLLPILNQFEQPWNPPPRLSIFCQHGNEECVGNTFESCVQDVAPTHADSFAVIDCIESRGCSEGQEPPQCVDEPGRVVQGCMRDFGQRISAPALLQCFHGNRASELLVMNDIASIKANVQWSPWVTVDGLDLIQDPNNPDDNTTWHESFLLGTRICNAYHAKTGKEPPAVCATYPKNVDQVCPMLASETGNVECDVWAKYPKANFTALIAKEQAELLQQQGVKLQAGIVPTEMWGFIIFAIAFILALGVVLFLLQRCCGKSTSDAAEAEALMGKGEHV